MKTTGYCILLLFFSFLLYTGRIVAQQTAAQLPDEQIKERLSYIERVLERGEHNAELWWYGWLIGYSSATAGQMAVYGTSDEKHTKQDMALGAATTLLGAVGQLIDPMVPGYAPDRLDKMPENTPEERRLKLIQAEDLLRRSALREKNGRSWKTHALTAAVNLGGGLVVWLGFKRSVWEGLANAALNTLVTEIQIFTQPTRAIKDYENYLNKYQAGEKPGLSQQRYTCFVGLYPGGVRLSIAF